MTANCGLFVKESVAKMSKVYSLFEVMPVFLKTNTGNDKTIEAMPNSDWLLKKEELGSYGEKIIKEFLEKNYNAIVTKQQDYIGYDFLVKIRNREFAVEVKTSAFDKNKFFISRNELEKAYELGEDYYIYKLYVEKDTNTLNIIQNPLKAFGIDKDKIFNSVVENDKVNIKIDGIEINMSDVFMEQLTTINVT